VVAADLAAIRVAHFLRCCAEPLVLAPQVLDFIAGASDSKLCAEREVIVIGDVAQFFEVGHLQTSLIAADAHLRIAPRVPPWFGEISAMMASKALRSTSVPAEEHSTGGGFFSMKASILSGVTIRSV